jgi:predicted transcriptional regulator of viral defense system
MRYNDFYNKFKDRIVFSITDIRKVDPKFDSAQLTEWQEKKYIKKVRRGFYVFSNENLNEWKLYYIANNIFKPSYVSLESALSRYNLIPEGVYTITSVTTNKTIKFEDGLARFAYRKILPSLNWGYELVSVYGVKVKMASIEKTVLDYLYFHPEMTDNRDFHEWRFNSEEFLEQANIKKYRAYAKMFKKKWMLEASEKLLYLIKNGSGIYPRY